MAVVAATVELTFWVLPIREEGPRLPPDGDNHLARFRPNESWRYAAGWDFFIVNDVRTNNAGWVSDIDYYRDADTPLLAFVGDSYVEGDHLEWGDTCHGRLAQLLEEEIRVYSFGMNAAPLSQHLAYAEHARDAYRPSALVIPIIDNDFDRSLRRFQRPRLHHIFFAFEETRDGGLVLAPPKAPPRDEPASAVSALRRWVSERSRFLRYRSNHVVLTRAIINEERYRNVSQPSDDFIWTHPATADPDRLTASRRAVDAFLQMLPERSGLHPRRVVFVVDGIRPFRYTEGWEHRWEGSYHDAMRRYFISEARADGYQVIDMHPVFVDHYRLHEQPFNWLRDIHWNTLGHGLCAEQVIQSPAVRELREETALTTR